MPDVISESPPEVLRVTYGKHEVQSGNTLTPTIVKHPPRVTWNTKVGSFYTLMLFDPDAPSRDAPKFKEWLHWLVINIPGIKLNRGEEICQYVGSAPPEGTGLHRYIFLLYEQKSKMKFEGRRLSKHTGSGRPKFCHWGFAQKHDLSAPIAGNFFVAEWDSYVPTVYKQLNGK